MKILWSPLKLIDMKTHIEVFTEIGLIFMEASSSLGNFNLHHSK